MWAAGVNIHGVGSREDVGGAGVVVVEILRSETTDGVNIHGVGSQ